MSLRYFYLFKPYGVLSQFSDESGRPTLRDIFPDAPADVYPVGRLDFDSEGLLILSNDPSLNRTLLHPTTGHEREYWVQVEGMMTRQSLQRLSQGVLIRVDGSTYRTKPCLAKLLLESPHLPERSQPIRMRSSIPVSWISLVLQEGKNRQVRRMTASVGFPTLRLVRYRMEDLTIEGIQPGEVRELNRTELFQTLRLL